MLSTLDGRRGLTRPVESGTIAAQLAGTALCQAGDKQAGTETRLLLPTIHETTEDKVSAACAGVP